MTMSKEANETGVAGHMNEGQDWVCPNCGCEIRIRHHGNASKMDRMVPFTCCCGTEMEPELPTAG